MKNSYTNLKIPNYFINRKVIVERTVRRILPRSLFSRSLLMILIPLIVTQTISLELFYGNYLSTVSRRLTDTVGSEVEFIVNQFNQTNSRIKYNQIIEDAQKYFQYSITWRKGQIFLGNSRKKSNIIGPVDELLNQTLTDRLDERFVVDWFSIKDQVKISIELKQSVVDILIPKKKLTAGSVWLFIFWIVGSALVLFIMTSVFAWIQFRAIRRLSRSVEKFGKGIDPGNLHPDGSRELRNAAIAFNVMRERILRYVKQRTVILASVSHDLRTPLTRLRLSLAMLPQKGMFNAEEQVQDILEMITDIEEMEQMISAYLSFARGEGTEEPILTDVSQLIKDCVAAASRADTRFLSVEIDHDLPDLIIRPHSIRRVFSNILDNAKRYGGDVKLRVHMKGKGIQFIIDDDGPGIEIERRESVFTPFETGNRQKGTGLGLSIAKNIIQGHGGDIKLETSPLGGLRVMIFIPR